MVTRASETQRRVRTVKHPLDLPARKERRSSRAQFRSEPGSWVAGIKKRMGKEKVLAMQATQK